MRRAKATAAQGQNRPSALEAQLAAATAAATAHPPHAATPAAAEASSMSAAPAAGISPAAASVFSCDRTREFARMLDAQRAINRQMGDPVSHAAAAAAILPRVHKPTPFTDSARHLLSSIRRMGEFLSSQRSEYLDLHRHLSTSSTGIGGGGNRRGGPAPLSDADRDRLESEVNAFVLQTNALVDQLKESIRPPRSAEDIALEQEALEDEPPEVRAAYEAQELEHHNADLRAHQHTVIIMLFDALRQLAASMASLKAQRTAQMRADVEERHPGALAMRDTLQRERRQRGATGAPTSSSGAASGTGEEDMTVSSLLGKAVAKSVNKLQRMGGANDEDRGAAMQLPPIDDAPPNAPVLSATELAMLQEENNHLLDSLEDQLDAMRRAESQMASIASLINLFNSKVLQQEEQIGTIYDNTVNSTLHVHAGINELKKAAQRGVTFRMMILFMIVVMSFSLLFLDWYTP